MKVTIEHVEGKRMRVSITDGEEHGFAILDCVPEDDSIGIERFEGWMNVQAFRTLCSSIVLHREHYFAAVKEASRT
jgi:hypothetical protein